MMIVSYVTNIVFNQEQQEKMLIGGTEQVLCSFAFAVRKAQYFECSPQMLLILVVFYMFAFLYVLYGLL